jgi:hypothetical protein
MSNRLTDLTTAIAGELTTLLAAEQDLDIQRRLNPLRQRQEFSGQTRYLSIFPGDYASEPTGRGSDQEQWTIVMMLQLAAPAASQADGGNPFGSVTSSEVDPVSWGDTLWDLVEQVKGFWRATDEGNGPLRDKLLAGCIFAPPLEHSPVYLPYHLEETGILSVPLVVSYTVDADEEDD